MARCHPQPGRSATETRPARRPASGRAGAPPLIVVYRVRPSWVGIDYYVDDLEVGYMDYDIDDPDRV